MAAGDRFGKLPIIVRKQSRGFVWRLFQFAVIVLGVMIVASSAYDVDEAPMLVVICVTVGVVVLLEIVRRLLARHGRIIVRIDADGVEKVEGDNTWRLPLTAYEGVLWREERRRVSNSSGGSRTRIVHLLELQHRSDERRTVTLLEASSPAGMRAHWEAAAGSLQLDALRRLSDDSLIRRRPEDLNKSLRTLAREGRIAVDPKALLPVPEGVSWPQDQPREATVRKPKAVLQFISLASLVPPVIGLFAAVASASLWPLLLLPAPFLAHHYRRRSRTVVAQEDGRLQLTAMLGTLPYWRRSFPVEEIEEVWSVRMRAGAIADEIRTLTVTSDRQTASLLALSRPVTDWLEQFVQMLVLTAPEDAAPRGVRPPAVATPPPARRTSARRPPAPKPPDRQVPAQQSRPRHAPAAQTDGAANPDEPAEAAGAYVPRWQHDRAAPERPGRKQSWWRKKEWRK